MTAVLSRALAAVTSRRTRRTSGPLDCCPHPDLDDFPEETSNG